MEEDISMAYELSDPPTNSFYQTFQQWQANQSRSFASIGPTLWNALSPSVRSTFLTGSLVFFAILKTYFFLMGPCTLAALLNGSPH